MNPHARDVIIAAVGLIVAAALLILSLIGHNVTLFVSAALASAAVAIGAGIYAFVQGWRWSQELSATGRAGWSIGVALLGGFMILLAGVALAAAAWVVLLFFIG